MQGIRRPSLPDSFGVKDNLAYHEVRLEPHTQWRSFNQHPAALPALLESDWRTRPARCSVGIWPAQDALHSDCLMLLCPAISQF